MSIRFVARNFCCLLSRSLPLFLLFPKTNPGNRFRDGTHDRRIDRRMNGRTDGRTDCRARGRSSSTFRSGCSAKWRGSCRAASRSRWSAPRRSSGASASGSAAPSSRPSAASSRCGSPRPSTRSSGRAARRSGSPSDQMLSFPRRARARKGKGNHRRKPHTYEKSGCARQNNLAVWSVGRGRSVGRSVGRAVGRSVGRSVGGLGLKE